MGREILTFGKIEIEKNPFHRHKTPIFLGDVDIEKVLARFQDLRFLTRFLLVKKPITTLLVTCIMIIKLQHYI